MPARFHQMLTPLYSIDTHTDAHGNPFVRPAIAVDVCIPSPTSIVFFELQTKQENETVPETPQGTPPTSHRLSTDPGDVLARLVLPSKPDLGVQWSDNPDTASPCPKNDAVATSSGQTHPIASSSNVAIGPADSKGESSVRNGSTPYSSTPQVPAV